MMAELLFVCSYGNISRWRIWVDSFFKVPELPENSAEAQIRSKQTRIRAIRGSGTFLKKKKMNKKKLFKSYLICDIIMQRRIYSYN